MDRTALTGILAAAIVTTTLAPAESWWKTATLGILAAACIGNLVGVLKERRTHA